MLVALFCCAASVSIILIGGVFVASGSADPPEGELTVSSDLVAGSFSGALNGDQHVLYADEAHGGSPFSGFSITDTRGTGVGWCVTVSATRLDNQSYPGKDLALNSLTMPRLAVEPADAGSSDPPDELHPAAAIDTGGDGVVMAACTEHGQGMGTYGFSAADGEPWRLVITAHDYSGVYTSTVTVTVSTLAL